MREIAEQLRLWQAEGSLFALATVVGVRGSAPCQPGVAMAVNAAGDVIGSVSGGCVEGAVYQAAVGVLGSGEAVRHTYGISDADAFGVGLTCGGTLDILIRPGNARVGDVLASLAVAEPVALATLIGGGDLDRQYLGRQMAVWSDRVTGSLGAGGLDTAVVDDAQGMLAQGLTGVRHYGPGGARRPAGVAVFIQAFAPPPRMIVFGATDFAAAVARVGSFLGYHITVCDARPVFATSRRFPHADEVVCEWPERFLARTRVEPSTVICVLTHDPKFDIPVLATALRSPASYVGAMGSRRTHADRLDRLRAAGLTDDELARLRSPIGLDLGARTFEETAVSIAAEIVQCRWGGSGRPLRTTYGRIHSGRAAG
ncbi:XdhC/CoxI family protein [Frankia sp. Cppng1_Ct_nod]|uniref:XdhC family protein n=1 Tax=Frankia sp. Cppng1_Ct_nod TaxID=2897162 RepID=UPI00104105B6|nr:XdhC/CoxI family protein [Frankia sp. Cppng1_Ct_nod]